MKRLLDIEYFCQYRKNTEENSLQNSQRLYLRNQLSILFASEVNIFGVYIHLYPNPDFFVFRYTTMVFRTGSRHRFYNSYRSPIGEIRSAQTFSVKM